MRRYLVLVFVLCLLVGCGGEPVPGEGPPPCSSVGETWTRPTDGMEMVCVPAGEFLMGSTDEDIDMVMLGCDGCLRVAFAREQPQHTVYLDAFWIDRTEVTNAQYRKCVEQGACKEPKWWGDDTLNAPDQPVVSVSWYDAQTYAAWAGGRLPTEAEWEKAARGTDGRQYPWGDQWEEGRSNTIEAGVMSTTPVGKYPKGASPYGLMDMAGNVWEMVADRVAADYYARSPARNPRGPETGELRVMRGGSWDNEAAEVRCAWRGGTGPVDGNVTWGFRLAVDADGSGP